MERYVDQGNSKFQRVANGMSLVSSGKNQNTYMIKYR